MKKLLFSALVLALPFNVMADTILGVKIGGGSWSHDPSGSIISTQGGTAGTSADLKDDLQLGKKSEGYGYISLEHPIPALPNIKLSQTNLTSSGSGSVTTDFTFNGTSYSASTAVTTEFELNQTDVILYYEILDNIVSFDVGLDAKTIDGKVVVNNESSTFSGTIPMLYLAAEIALPAGFAISAEISTISASGSSYDDVTAKVSYTSDYLFGVEAGIRTQTIKADVDDVDATIDFKGPFAGVFLKF